MEIRWPSDSQLDQTVSATAPAAMLTANSTQCFLCARHSSKLCACNSSFNPQMKLMRQVLLQSYFMDGDTRGTERSSNLPPVPQLVRRQNEGCKLA